MRKLNKQIRKFLLMLTTLKANFKENKKRSVINMIKIGLLSFFIISFGFSEFSLISLNQDKFQKEGELTEIIMVKDQIKDISQSYEQLWYELLDKDFEMFKSIEKGDINDTEALHILYPLVHRADLLFAKFLMTSKFHRISQFIKYDIFEYITDLLVPTFHLGEAYHHTSDLIVFNIVISKYDNISEYLKRFSIYGEYDLTKFEYKTYLTEDNQSSYFLYDKTWEIFYNYTYYGIVNIFANFQLFDAIIERFYVIDLKIVEEKIVGANIWLNISNISIIVLSFAIGFKRRKIVKNQSKI